MNRRSLNRRAVLGRTATFAAALGLGGRRPSLAQEATPEGQSLAGTPTSDELLSQWAPGQTATINGAALYYEDHGDPAAQPVLLLHGGLSNAEWWVNVAPVLVAADYRVVAMDSRGHGRSAWGDKPITYEQMAADTFGLLDQLGIPKADVVGWSDGAIIALDLAIHHSERLGRIVAYGANFTPDGVHDLVPTDQLPPFERLIADYRRLAPQPGRFEELAGVLDALYKVSPNYSEAQLGSIGVPILVLDGAEEEFIKTEHTRRLAQLIPGATLLIMPGTGHFAPFAKPVPFNQIMLDYLAGRAPGAAATPAAGTPTP